MKKLIFIIVVMLIGYVATAQTDFTSKTITDTETVVSDTIHWTGDGVLSIQVLYTQLTGTSAGTAVLKGSLDGVIYTVLSDDTYGNFLWFSNNADTISSTDGVSWAIDLKGKHGLNYFCISTTGTGTQTTTFSGSYDIIR